jgi:preprotein translocase, YajC subunit
MYFLLIRPQKKREKAVTAMRNTVKVGDEIITIGGVCGKIVKTKDETLTIQVGADKTKFEIMRWAVSKVVSDESAAGTAKKAKKEDAAEDQKEAPKKALPKRMKKAESNEVPDATEPEAEVKATEEAEVTEEK